MAKLYKHQHQLQKVQKEKAFLYVFDHMWWSLLTVLSDSE